MLQRSGCVRHLFSISFSFVVQIYGYRTNIDMERKCGFIHVDFLLFDIFRMVQIKDRNKIVIEEFKGTILLLIIWLLLTFLYLNLYLYAHISQFSIYYFLLSKLLYTSSKAISLLRLYCFCYILMLNNV